MTENLEVEIDFFEISISTFNGTFTRESISLDLLDQGLKATKSLIDDVVAQLLANYDIIRVDVHYPYQGKEYYRISF